MAADGVSAKKHISGRRIVSRFFLLCLLILPLALFARLLRVQDRLLCRAQLGCLCGVGRNAPMIDYYEPCFSRGQFPSSLVVFAEVLMKSFNGCTNWDEMGDSNVLCPGRKGSVPGSWRDIEAWSDYTYVYWPSGRTGTPPDYPLMYDRRLSNHQGKGINIVTVGKKVFWDRNSKWLRKFAQGHPEFNIPLPEDLVLLPGARQTTNRLRDE